MLSVLLSWLLLVLGMDREQDQSCLYKCLGDNELQLLKQLQNGVSICFHMFPRECTGISPCLWGSVPQGHTTTPTQLQKLWIWGQACIS